MTVSSCSSLITATLIVRNEATTITRALLSLKPYVARMIVVDTGSTDATPQICSRLGAEVYYSSWENDFAQARNAALTYVRTPWTLSIDADEELAQNEWQESLDFLADHMNNHQCGGINVILYNILQSGTTATTHRYTRLFRTHPSIRYAGAIHEQIRPSIEELGFFIAESTIMIRHYGYAENRADKIERNRILLQQAIADDDSAWNRYHLAMTEFSAQHTSRAKELFQSVLHSTMLTQEQTELARLRLAQIALGASRYDECLEYTMFESSDLHREGFRHYIRATAYLQKKEIAAMLIELEHHGVQISSLVDQTNVSLMRSVADHLRSAKTH